MMISRCPFEIGIHVLLFDDVQGQVGCSCGKMKPVPPLM
jgi:hypothetical protein